MLLLALVLALDPTLETIAATVGGTVGGTVGFAALDLSSGRSLRTHESQSFPMQSVFKLPVAIEVLRQVDAGKLALDREIALGRKDARDGNAFTMKVPAKRTIGQLLEAMLVTSDNVACDKLLSLIGGPRVVDPRMKELGVSLAQVSLVESPEPEVEVLRGSVGTFNQRGTHSNDQVTTSQGVQRPEKDSLSGREYELGHG
ncbi:MAG: beta-lactamase class [Myxococcales bacterium]|nr:beta-lactamase class [Myxococcales bacterium]